MTTSTTVEIKDSIIMLQSPAPSEAIVAELSIML
jgi:hypothetical protein